MTHPLFINHWAWLNLAWVRQWLTPGTWFSIRLSLNVLPFCTSLPNPNILQNFQPFQAKCWKMIKNTFKILQCELSSGQKLQQIDISGKKLFYGESDWQEGKFKRKWTRIPGLYTVQGPNNSTDKSIQLLKIIVDENPIVNNITKKKDFHLK